MSRESVNYFSQLIEAETGIVFHETNIYQLTARLEEIVKLEKLLSIDELAMKFKNKTRI